MNRIATAIAAFAALTTAAHADFTELVITDTGAEHRGQPIYELVEPLVYVSVDGYVVVVPAGFLTDLASIPERFHDRAPPDGIYAKAAVVHDYLYVYQPVSRWQADYLFLQAMEELGVTDRGRRIMYTMVRVFGGNAWRHQVGWRP